MYPHRVLALATLLACIVNGPSVASESNKPNFDTNDKAALRLRSNSAATTNADTEDRSFWRIEKTITEKLRSKIDKQVTLIDILKKQPNEESKIIRDLKRLDKEIKPLLETYKHELKTIREIIQDKTMKRDSLADTLGVPKVGQFLFSKQYRKLRKISKEIKKLEERESKMKASFRRSW
ncbi:uncharacterized protein CCR75_008369 [Bremia lactucae]|uniref:RxLR effector protein n=1 Tax=Bremia lactucae TaxID=4779 RepID=A0A976NY54_BRELC|nr:hypothetical protein CCR75_008369 [Bremia lactucae]